MKRIAKFKRKVTRAAAPSRGRGLKRFILPILLPRLPSPLHGGVD